MFNSSVASSCGQLATNQPIPDTNSSFKEYMLGTWYVQGWSKLGLQLFIWKKTCRALAGVAQWIEHSPANQRVAGSIPSQGMCLGCGPGPQ